MNGSFSNSVGKIKKGSFLKRVDMSVVCNPWSVNNDSLSLKMVQKIMYIKSAKDCQYIGVTDYNRLIERNQRVGQMLGNMINKADVFCNK